MRPSRIEDISYVNISKIFLCYNSSIIMNILILICSILIKENFQNVRKCIQNRIKISPQELNNICEELQIRGMPSQFDNWESLSRTEILATGDLPRKVNVNSASLPVSGSMKVCG